MLSLQHQGAEGIAEAFRFTAPPAGKASFVSRRMSAERVSWRTGTVIKGYVSGRVVGGDAFKAELAEWYPQLLGCACWDFAVLHPHTFEPLARTGENDSARGYLLLVDDVPVAIRLLYDWGSWCYLVYSVGELFICPALLPARPMD